MNSREQVSLPPHSIESEQSVIGGLLLDNLAFDRVAGLVAESDFYQDCHRRIYRHIVELIEAGKPADVVTVFESLETSNESDQAGGLPYLGEIANNVPSSANIVRYAEVVRERAVLRGIASAAAELAASATRPGTRSVDEVLDQAERAIYALRTTSKRRQLVSMRDALGNVIERMQAACDGNLPLALHCGLPGLDRITRGMRPGDLVLLAARPAVGKSALALQVAVHAAHSTPVLFASLEMRAEANADRALASESGLPLDLIQDDGPRTLSEEQWSAVTAGLGRLNDLPITFLDCGALTVPSLATTARRMRRRGLGLIVVDYLQLLSVAERRQNRTEAVGELSRGLKLLAMELGVPVIALSQLSRAAVGERPSLAHLRESGSLEQDADVVILLHDVEGRPTECIVAKNRRGATGSVWLDFDKARARFAETAPPNPNNPPSTGFPRKRGFSE
jgi:replicative DNA helicase